MKKIFEMCIMLTLMLFVVNTGFIAFEGKIITGSDVNVSEDILAQAGISTDIENPGGIADVNAAIGSQDSSIRTESSEQQEAQAQSEEAQDWLGLITTIIYKLVFGYQLILQQILPWEISYIIISILTVMQLIAGAYIALVLLSLARGGYNPG